MKILSRASQIVSNPSYLQIPYKNLSDVRFIPPDDDAALVSSHAAAAPRTDWRAPRTRQHPRQPQHGRRYRLRAQRPSKIALQLRFWCGGISSSGYPAGECPDGTVELARLIYCPSTFTISLQLALFIFQLQRIYPRYKYVQGEFFSLLLTHFLVHIPATKDISKTSCGTRSRFELRRGLRTGFEEQEYAASSLASKNHAPLSSWGTRRNLGSG